MKEHRKEEWNKLTQEVQNRITNIFDLCDLCELRHALAEIYNMGYEDALHAEEFQLG